MKKPSPRSALKTLPPETQEALWQYLLPAEKHTLADGVAWLAANGVDTQDSSLSEWRRWYPIWIKLQRAASVTDSVKEVLAVLPELKLGEHQLSQAMQATFEAEAMQAGDSELFLALRKLRQNDRSLDLQQQSGETKARQKDAQIRQKDADLQLAERRVKLLEENQREAKEKLTAVLKTSKGGLTPETLKQIEEAAGLL